MHGNLYTLACNRSAAAGYHVANIDKSKLCQREQQVSETDVSEILSTLIQPVVEFAHACASLNAPL